MKEYLTEALPRQAADWLPKVGSALLVLFVFWLLAVVARKVVRKAGVAAGIDSSVINLLARSAHVVLLVIGLVTALGTLGIDVSAIVASLGLTGFAVGFALKDSISNLLSGVLILIHRPFNVGDTIKVKTFEGLVRPSTCATPSWSGTGRKSSYPTRCCSSTRSAFSPGRRTKIERSPYFACPNRGCVALHNPVFIENNRQNHRRSVSRPAGQLGLCPGGFCG